MQKRAAYRSDDFEIIASSPDWHLDSSQAVVPMSTTSICADAVAVAVTVLIKGRPALMLNSQAPCSTAHGTSGGIRSGTDGGPSVIVGGCATVLVEGLPIAHDGAPCHLNQGNTLGVLSYVVGSAATAGSTRLQTTTPLGPATATIAPQLSVEIVPPIEIPRFDSAALADQQRRSPFQVTSPLSGTGTQRIWDLPQASPPSVSEQGAWMAVEGVVEMAGAAVTAAGGPEMWGISLLLAAHGMDRFQTGLDQYLSDEPRSTLLEGAGQLMAAGFGASPEEQEATGRLVDAAVLLLLSLKATGSAGRGAAAPASASEEAPVAGVFVEADGPSVSVSRTATAPLGKAVDPGQMSAAEIELFRGLSKKFRCRFIICGRRAETNVGLENRAQAWRMLSRDLRERIQLEHPENWADFSELEQAQLLAAERETGIPFWRNTGPSRGAQTGRQELDFLYRDGDDLPDPIQEAVRDHLGPETEFDNWINKLDQEGQPSYAERDPFGLVFDDGEVDRVGPAPWQIPR